MENLAIVGAGVGGCSAAYFARKYLPGTNVTIYDSRDRIGGRIKTYRVGGMSLELGAAFFNGFNKTLLRVAEAERLRNNRIREHQDFGVWNGSELIFRSNRRSFLTNTRLLAKYTLSIARAFRLLREAKEQIVNLYEELKNPVDLGKAFESTGLDRWYSSTFVEILIERGCSQTFIDEIVTPITRAIYTQNADLGGFAGITSLIGVYTGAPFSLDEGNDTLPVRLAGTSKATVKLCQRVDTIEKMSNSAYRVTAGEEAAVFDRVIVATPLELAGINFDGVSMEGVEHQPYRTVYKKAMKGIFDQDYFGLKKSESPPAVVLTTEDVGQAALYSIQEVGKGESMVTITSQKPLDRDAFKGIFRDGGSSVLEHCWKAAYPIFKPVAKLPPTQLDKRLIYINAIESAVASMETSMLSALNAVRILGKE